MLNVTVLCVGKLKEKYLKDACSEYIKRLSAFCKITVTELDEERLPSNYSDANIKEVVEAEGRRISAKIPAGACLVTMCIEGKKLTSEGLSDFLQKTPLNGVSDIVFVIGGSYGIADELKQKSKLRLSMSDMTFPHQLARVMLLEQIYRGFQIAVGTKYHK